MWTVRWRTRLVKAKDDEILQATGNQLETFHILTSEGTNKLNASKGRTRIKHVTIHDYVEVSKPRIVVVLVVTAIASLLACTRFDSTPEVAWDVNAWQIGFLTLAGALASMGASALNHYYDRDIDKIMERTAKRPIPDGRLSPKRVFAYGFTLCMLSILIAFFTLNPVATGMIAIGIFFYVIVYTAWLKRSNASNIVIGGFAGSAALMAGWATATGSIDLLGFLVGWLVSMWTPPHFWCLAIRAREEYASVHVPMLPVLIGNQRTASHILINTAILLLIFRSSGILWARDAIHHIGSVRVIDACISLQGLTKNPTPEFAWKAYKVTAPYLVVIFVALGFDALFHYPLVPAFSLPLVPN